MTARGTHGPRATVNRCTCGYREFIDFLEEARPVRVGTLGPAKTSSDAVAAFLVENFHVEDETTVDLFPTFDDVLAALLDGSVDLALVPHAYDRINVFYMCSEAELRLVFVHATPVYGLARDRGTNAMPRGEVTIASHPAPLPLLASLLAPTEYARRNRAVRIVESTSAAAALVESGEAELAVTNEHAAHHHGLEFVETYGPIRMSWSVFSRRRA